MFDRRACGLRFLGGRTAVLGGRAAVAGVRDRRRDGARIGPNRTAAASGAVDSDVGGRVRPLRLPGRAAMPARARRRRAWAPRGGQRSSRARQRAQRSDRCLQAAGAADGRRHRHQLLLGVLSRRQARLRMRRANSQRRDARPGPQLGRTNRDRRCFTGPVDPVGPLRPAIRGDRFWTDRDDTGANSAGQRGGRPLARARAALQGRGCRSDSCSIGDRHGRMFLVRQRVWLLRPCDRSAR